MNTPIENNMSSQDFSNNESMTKGESYKPMISGVLLIIAGVLGVMNFAIYISANAITVNTLADMFSQASINVTIPEIKNFLLICGTIGIIISIFPILSSILCFKRKLWGFAVGTSIIGIFSFGPVFISSILCIIAVILISISKNEFN